MATELRAAIDEAVDCLEMALSPFPLDEARTLRAAMRLKAAVARPMTREQILRAADMSGAVVLEGFTVDMLHQFAQEILAR